MHDDEVRSEPELIDGPWLTDALEDAGVARGSKVTEVDFGGWIGTGQTGRNARFALTWDDPEGRPASLVAKVPSGDPHARAAAFASGTYLKECRFYDRVADTVDIRTPGVHVVRYDAVGEDFCVLMEDLSGSEQGDQLDGLDVDRIELALDQMVALHAPRFGEAGLERMLGEDLPALTPEEAAGMAQMMYAATLPGFLDRLGDRLDDDVAKLASDFAPLVSRWALGSETPNTVVHLDFRADNLLFATTPQAPPLVVVDWQTVSVGLAQNDLAYLISGSFPDASARADAERELVEVYRSRMATAGVEQSADDCWQDYRIGSLWGMVITVIATVSAARTERGDDMLTAMAQRHGRQALDLDALSLLR